MNTVCQLSVACVDWWECAVSLQGAVRVNEHIHFVTVNEHTRCFDQTRCICVYVVVSLLALAARSSCCTSNLAL